MRKALIVEVRKSKKRIVAYREKNILFSPSLYYLYYYSTTLLLLHCVFLFYRTTFESMIKRSINEHIAIVVMGLFTNSCSNQLKRFSCDIEEVSLFSFLFMYFSSKFIYHIIFLSHITEALCSFILCSYKRNV